MERVLIVDDNPDIREVLGTYAAKGKTMSGLWGWTLVQMITL